MEKISTGKKFVLGIQHLFAMFGATVLVPMLTGLNPAVALICAGIGTLLFHLCTGGKVPVFLGSSFAFIAAIQHACIGNNEKLLAMLREGKPMSDIVIQPEYIERIPYAMGGVMVAGLIYVLLSFLIRLVGADRIRRLFPPIVVGPVIVVIGLTLSPSAINMARGNWIVALITLAVVIAVTIFARGFFKLVPVLIGIFTGYVVSAIWQAIDPSAALMNFAPVIEASWISPFWDFGHFFMLPKFELNAILMIAPVALVTFMEHIGDITTNGSVVGKDFIKDPGLHRTLLGDGVATMVAGLIGGPANTTYGENTGVLAVTQVYDPSVLRFAAVYAIILGLIGKFGAILQTIPQPVLGGVSILLFGMIAAVGMRTLVESRLDFSHSRNLIITAIILVVGLGLSGGVAIGGVTLSGLFIAVVSGVIMNLILPEEV